MRAHLPKSGADRFWSAVTAATIVGLTCLIAKVGPEAPVSPTYAGTVMAAQQARDGVAANPAATRAMPPAVVDQATSLSARVFRHLRLS